MRNIEIRQRPAKLLLLDAQDAPVLAHCADCEAELYDGAEAYRMENGVVCPRCMTAFGRVLYGDRAVTLRARVLS